MSDEPQPRRTFRVYQTFDGVDPDRIARELQRALFYEKAGTLASVVSACDRQIEYQRPVGVSRPQVQRELALYWLEQQRPNGFVAKLSYLWRLVRVLW